MKPKAIITSLAFCALASGLQAATLYWDGGASTANNLSENTTSTGLTWLGTGATAGNWDNGTTSATVDVGLWNPGDSAVFGGTAATQTVTAGTLTIGNLTFGGGGDGTGTSGTAYTISGGTLTLSAPSTVTTNTNTSMSSALAGSGSLVKQGDATLTLTGTANYTGTTTVNAGKLVFTTTGTDRFSSNLNTNGISIASGATFELNTPSGNPRFSSANNSITGGGTFVKSGASTTYLANGTTRHQKFDLSSGGLINISAGTISDFETVSTNKADLVIASGATAQQITTDSSFDSLSGGGTLANGNNKILTFGADNGSGTFTGNISGTSGSFVKTGNGTQVLGGANTYGGATTINGGTLVLAASGTLSSSDITVKNGATFQIDAAGKSLKSLAVENGATLTLPAATAATTILTNALTLTATPSFTVKPLFTTLPQTGNTFDLLTAPSVSGSAGAISTDFSAGGLTRVAGNAAISGNKLVLTITSGAGSLIWSNTAATGVWNFNGDANFSGATPGTFLNYDSVTFGNTAAGTVTLLGSLLSSAVNVNASANYTFAGSGSITGAATLTKSGSGSLTIQNANAHLGGTVLSGGTLALGNAAALGTGILTFNGGTLDSAMSGLTLTTNNAQNWAADFAFTGTNDLNLGTGAVTLGANRQVTVNAGNLTVGGAISGTTLGITKTGAGTLSLTGSNSYTGTTAVNAGTLRLAGNANSLTNAAYNIGVSGTVQIDTDSSTWTARNGLSFAGSVGKLVKTGTGNLDLGGSDYATNMGMDPGALIDIQQGAIRLAWGYNKTTWANNKADMNIAAGANFDVWDYGNTGANYARIDALTGSGTIQRGVTGTTTGGVEIGVDNGSGTFDGVIQNGIGTSKLNLMKSGTGTQTLTGINSYSGTTTVNGGILEVTGSLSNSAVTVNANGTLAGTGTVNSASVSGKVSPGGSAIGTLSVNNALTLNAGGTTVCQIDKTGGNLTADLLYVTSVTYGGTLEVTATGAPLEAGDTFKLVDSLSFNGTFASFSLPALPTGLSWELTNLAVDGSIMVVNRTPTPLFNPPSGGYVGGRSVTISSDSGSTVYYTYTTNGSTPATPTTGSASGTTGSGAATIVVPSDADYKIRAFATRSGYSNSLIAEAEYNTITTPTWIYPGGGSWSDPFNWQKSIIPDGADITADLGTQTLGEDSTVSIDSARTLGTLVLGDQGNQYDWTLTGSTLTMAGTAPEIAVTNRTTSISASVAGSAPVSKTGAGTLRLTGSANYTGATSVNAGRLVLESNTNDRFSSNLNTANIAIASGATFEFKATATDVRFSSANNEIVGAGTFEKTGTGTGYLANSTTRHQQFNLSAGGLIHVMEGRLSDFQAAGSNLGGLTIDAGTTAQQITADSSFGALNGAGTLANGNGRILTFGAGNGSGTFGGTLTGAGTFLKQGTGTQSLGGDSSATATFTVEGGTIAVNNTTGSATGTGAVTVKTTATLAGTGSIGGDTTVEAGGFVAPGNAGIGTLTLASATFAGTYQCEIGATTCDHVVVTGALNSSPGATISISTNGTPTAAEYVIATCGSLTGVVPAITGIPAGYTVDTNTAGVIKLVSGSSGFQGWIDGFASLTNPADKLPNADPDHDGIANIVEFVTNGNPTSGTGSNLPTCTAAGSNLVFTFTRRDDAAYLNPFVEFSAGLQGTWTKAQDGVNCTITVQPNGTDPDTVTVSIPKGANTQLFARLAVTQ